jgi:hypothetical protein
MSLEDILKENTAAMKELTAALKGGVPAADTPQPAKDGSKNTSSNKPKESPPDDTGSEEELRAKLLGIFKQWVEVDKAAAGSWLRGFTGVKKGPIKIQQIEASMVGAAIGAVEKQLAIVAQAKAGGVLPDDDMV